MLCFCFTLISRDFEDAESFEKTSKSLNCVGKNVTKLNPLCKTIPKSFPNYVTFALSTRMKPHVNNMDDNEVKRDL